MFFPEAGFPRVKDRQINSVMNGADIIILQKGLSDLAFQPERRSHNRQLTIKRIEEFLLAGIVLSDIHAIPGNRILIQTRAFHAFGLPLFTMKTVIMRTMPGERPAIMEGPDYRFSAFLQIMEQNLCIQIIAMQIMEMNQVRIE